MCSDDCLNVDAPCGLGHLVNIPGISDITLYISDLTASWLKFPQAITQPNPNIAQTFIQVDIYKIKIYEKAIANLPV